MPDLEAAALDYLTGFVKVNPGVYSKSIAANVLRKSATRWGHVVKDAEGYESAGPDAERIANAAVAKAISSGQLQERGGMLYPAQQAIRPAPQVR